MLVQGRPESWEGRSLCTLEQVPARVWGNQFTPSPRKALSIVLRTTG